MTEVSFIGTNSLELPYNMEIQHWKAFYNDLTKPQASLSEPCVLFVPEHYLNTHEIFPYILHIMMVRSVPCKSQFLPRCED
jgi:hypothetical protein